MGVAESFTWKKVLGTKVRQKVWETATTKNNKIPNLDSLDQSSTDQRWGGVNFM